MTGIAQTMTTEALPPPGAAKSKVGIGSRIGSIDALRGLVMLLMLLDHTRETFWLFNNVGDPVNANTVAPALFFTRLTSTICAPVFVVLTGLSAYLYGQKHTRPEVTWFLFSRGLFLIALELTVISFAWPTQPLTYPPPMVYLQVIWAIGVCMIALSGLIYLPRWAQLALGLGIVCFHNLLSGFVLTPDSPFYTIWGVLYQRTVFEFSGGAFAIKTSYPVLPWIGVILTGYACGPLFGRDAAPEDRRRRLLLIGAGLIGGFIILRFLNFYGDAPWFVAETPLRTVMSFLAMTKYPPSLLFLMPTAGLGCLILAWFESDPENPILAPLARFGGAPMFFYIVHLYVLKVLYNGLYAIFGPNKGELYGFGHFWMIWAAAALLIALMYVPTRWFAQLKQRNKSIWWLKYL